jgi:hypothetical protein
MAANSQTLNWTSQTAASVSAVTYSPVIIVENFSGQTVYARADGQAAVAQAAGTIEIANGATEVLDNGQPLVNANTGAYKGNGGTGAFDQSEAAGWTARQNNLGQYADAAHATVVSLVPAASATGTVNVTFQ